MKSVAVLAVCATVALAGTAPERKRGGMMVGGPNSLPFWLKPGYTGKQPPFHLDHLKKDTPVAETSGLVDTVKGHVKKAKKWAKNKLGGKKTAPAPAPVAETPAPEAETSAFGAKLKGHVQKAKTWVKGKLGKTAPAPAAETPAPEAETSGLGAKLKGHVQKAKTWVKSKLGGKKKPETATPAPVAETPAPEAETSAFGAKLKGHVQKAKNWVKGKLGGKKTETPLAPASTEEPTQESAFTVEDAKTHATNAMNKVKEHGAKIHQWFKSKLGKTQEETTQ